jgi:hypothetical protein
MVDRYPQFYWSKIERYIGNALRYLEMTMEGKQWIATLYCTSSPSSIIAGGWVHSRALRGSGRERRKRKCIQCDWKSRRGCGTRVGLAGILHGRVFP